MEKEIREAIENELLKENIILLNVSFGEENNEKTLFITIDSDKGVDTDLCVKSMKIVRPLIEKLDIDLSEYVIDVGSKGE